MSPQGITSKNTDKFSTRRDIFCVIIFNTIVLLTFSYFDISERLSSFFQEHEEYEIDEILPFLCVFSLSLLWLTARRHTQTKKLKEHYIYAANHEAITGLFTRTALTERALHYMEYARQHNEPCSLIMLELTNLRSINEKNGHRAGDYALKEIASILQDLPSQNCVSARWSSKIFLIVCRQTTRKEALVITHQLHRDMNTNSILQSFKPTVLTSVVSYDEEPSLEKAVDLALNRLLIAQNTPESKRCTSSHTTSF